MEYVYAAMLLHKAGKPIDEENVTKVLEAAGIQTDPTRVKALVAALSEVDIDEAIKSAPTLTAAAPAAAPAEAAPAAEEKPAEEKEEEEEKKEEEALEGLGALFG
ncbi:50S ribosomal protein P1 [Candidatus Bathyarchaeota archaeon]|nr:MAG: 50S ribosomal protein P1 [Candidatus Bathyarchaeota archaeon]